MVRLPWRRRAASPEAGSGSSPLSGADDSGADVSGASVPRAHGSRPARATDGVVDSDSTGECTTGERNADRTAVRHAGHSRGARGELLAAEFLRRAGYRIVARNLRTRHAEFDLIVRRRRLFVAVEVKTRTRHRAPERTVEPAQFERLQRALQALAPTLWPRPRELRVDVVAVRLESTDPRAPVVQAAHRIRHFEGQPFDPPKPR